jgi:hypothetical protein
MMAEVTIRWEGVINIGSDLGGGGSDRSGDNDVGCDAGRRMVWWYC